MTEQEFISAVGGLIGMKADEIFDVEVLVQRIGGNKSTFIYQKRTESEAMKDVQKHIGDWCRIWTRRHMDIRFNLKATKINVNIEGLTKTVEAKSQTIPDICSEMLEMFPHASSIWGPDSDGSYYEIWEA